MSAPTVPCPWTRTGSHARAWEDMKARRRARRRWRRASAPERDLLRTAAELGVDITGDWPCPECEEGILDDEGHCRLCGYAEDLNDEGDEPA